MKLRPLSHLDLRRKKALEHYFHDLERWWELSDQPLADWCDQRVRLDAGQLVGRIDRAELGDGRIHPVMGEVLDDGHARWFRTTEGECDHAELHRHPLPSRQFLISANGVVVVVAEMERDPSLVTAFRPDPVAPEGTDFLGAARNYVKRAADRRTHRRASYE